MVRAAAALGAVLCTVGAARAAAPQDDYLARLATAVRTGLDAAALAHAPKLVPPVPVKVTWKAVRLGSVDLGAPLVALTAADLDHDGKGELYAVTPREVVAVGIDHRVRELGRVAFGGPPAMPVPRDVVGTAIVDGGEVVAAVSAWATELRVGWTNKVLGAHAGAPGFAVCPGERLALAPGRNYFGDAASPIYGVRCTQDLVDPAGRPLAVRAVLTGTRLTVTVGQGASYELGDYGVAFALADVDRDGKPEIIVSGAGAPGDPDAIKVITLGGDEKKGLFRRQFTGGVAGIAVIDGDGDGAVEVIAAVRLAGATRVDLWRLD